MIYYYIYTLYKGGLFVAKKEKKVLTAEEKKKKIKEEIQSWLFCLGFLLIFIAAFAFYGLQGNLFGR